MRRGSERGDRGEDDIEPIHLQGAHSSELWSEKAEEEEEEE